jgi:hypothetical protein
MPAAASEPVLFVALKVLEITFGAIRPTDDNSSSASWPHERVVGVSL